MIDSRWFVVALVLGVVMWVPESVVGQPPLPGYCMQPPPRSDSPCTIDIEGFYFDPRTNDCEPYQVGGCRSVLGQSFGSRDDCLATCVYRTRNLKDRYNYQ